MRLPAHQNLADVPAGPAIPDTSIAERMQPVPQTTLADGGAPVASARSNCTGARVLLVCQEERSREQFQRVAEETQAGLVVADSTEAALRLLARQPFDVAIVDTTLRSGAGVGGSNRDLLESIRLHWSWIQLILLSSLSDEQPPRAAVRMGISESLTKPCSQREIVAALTRACRRRVQDGGASIMAVAPSNLPIMNSTPTTTGAPISNVSTATNAIDGTLEYVERVHILAALQRHHGNRELAAQALGISVRKLYYRLRQYAREGHVAH